MAEPRVAVIAQARLGSSRLPGKVLRRVGGMTLLEHLVRRLELAQRPDVIVIATTTAPADARIVTEAQRLGVRSFRGSEDDVLSRYRGAAAEVGADVVVRVTADCPLLDPVELDRVIEAYLCRLGTAQERDFVRNQQGAIRRIAHGHDVEVFSYRLLCEAAGGAEEAGDREHVTPYFYRVEGRYRTLVTDPPGPDHSGLRLTVDTPGDLAFVEAVMAGLGVDAGADAIAAWLVENPEVCALNADVKQRGIDSVRQHREQRVRGKTLLARADAGRHIGFGHVARLEAVLDAWAELGGRALLFGSGVEGSIRARLEQAGVEVLDKAAPEADGGAPEAVRVDGRDLEETAEMALREGAVAVALDGYGFKEPYRRGLAGVLPLLAIDDLADFPVAADVVLNQNMGFDPERYEASCETALLVGHEYALFRREFREVARGQAAQPHSGTRRVLLTFGGSDPARLTLPTARALLDVLAPADEVVAIAGGGMDGRDRVELDALVASAGGRLEVLTDVRQMASVIEGATVAITAAGSTTWELIVCGVPPLAVPVAENQRAVARGVGLRKVGIDLGWHEDLKSTDVAAQTLSLLDDGQRRQEMVQRGRALIDGRGVWRAIDALLEAIERRGVTQ